MLWRLRTIKTSRSPRVLGSATNLTIALDFSTVFVIATVVTGVLGVFSLSPCLPARVLLSSLIIATYPFPTAAALSRERRKHLLQRWPAIFVPILHGAVFLAPIPLASVLPDDRGIVSLASGWIAVFALEVMLYIVGTAFIILVLAKERAVRIHKDAAATDELTGLLNRRGFLQGAEAMVARGAQTQEAV